MWNGIGSEGTAAGFFIFVVIIFVKMEPTDDAIISVFLFVLAHFLNDINPLLP